MNNKKVLTIYDIATELKLSPSTISRALQDHYSIGKKTTEKVKGYAAKHGYKPNGVAASLRNNKTKTIGVIVPWVNRPFISSLISGIELGATESNYNVIISQSHDNYDNEVACATSLFSSRVEGVVVSLSVKTKDFSHFDRFLNSNIPIVFADRWTEEIHADKIMIDNFKAGFTATEHLIQQGCKRIAHLGGLLDQKIYRERQLGYVEALKQNNLPIDERLIIHNLLSAEEGFKSSDILLDMDERPDGIFCANDTVGVSTIQNAKKRGIKVPEELAVIGFNNDPISLIIDPPLSTISHPAKEMGLLAAEQVLKRKEGSESVIRTETIILKTELLARESSIRR
jgi:DNA-binding LacI/PurR family transcriptional regulator